MSDDFSQAAEQTRYVRADELAHSGPLQSRSWLWPWGVVGLIGFLALTGFFMTLLRPAPENVPINEGSISTAPLANEPSVAAPLPDDSRLVAVPATISAVPGQPNPPADGQAPAPVEAPPTVTVPATPPAVAAKPDSVATLVGKTPRIAILVMDIGADAKIAQAAINELPEAVDLGFTSSGKAHIQAAAAKGHKVWLGIPMQPRRYPAINPGPATLLLKNSAAQNSKYIATAMAAATPGYTGLYNIMGSAFTADRAALAPVMAAAQSNGLAFFDTRAGSDTVAATLAREQSIPAAINDAYLDNEPAKLAQRLNELAMRAKSRGVAIGVMSPTPQAVAGLKAWLATPAGQSVELVSARSVAATVGLQKLQP
jgi:uncharacterized protein